MSDSSQAPRDVCCTVVSEQCHEDHKACLDHGEVAHVHIHVHVHHKCCSTGAVSVPVPVPVAEKKLPVIRLGFTNIAIGSPNYSKVMPQVKLPANYGAEGTYNKIQSVITFDAMADIVSATVTAAELKAKYDVLSVGLHVSTFTVAQAAKLKAYADLGGVLLLTCDNSTAAGMTNVLQVFGHTGSFVVTPSFTYSGVSSASESFSSYFGNSEAVPLKGGGLFVITAAQLPVDSRVIATYGTNVLFWVVGGTKGRVIAFSDIDLAAIDVDGATIDNGQERFLNNMMAYVFDQVLVSAV